MILRGIQSIKIMELIINIKTFGYFKAQADEVILDLTPDLCERMQSTSFRQTTRKCQVKPGCFLSSGIFLLNQVFLLLTDQFFQLTFCIVDDCPECWTFFLGKFTQTFQEISYLAVLAQVSGFQVR